MFDKIVKIINLVIIIFFLTGIFFNIWLFSQNGRFTHEGINMVFDTRTGLMYINSAENKRFIIMDSIKGKVSEKKIEVEK